MPPRKNPGFPKPAKPGTTPGAVPTKGGVGPIPQPPQSPGMVGPKGQAPTSGAPRPAPRKRKGSS